MDSQLLKLPLRISISRVVDAFHTYISWYEIILYLCRSNQLKLYNLFCAFMLCNIHYWNAIKIHFPYYVTFCAKWLLRSTYGYAIFWIFLFINVFEFDCPFKYWVFRADKMENNFFSSAFTFSNSFEAPVLTTYKKFFCA